MLLLTPFKKNIYNCKSHLLCLEIGDEDNSIAAMYQTITDLPQPNRDTLAFLILHLQR